MCGHSSMRMPIPTNKMLKRDSVMLNRFSVLVFLFAHGPSGHSRGHAFSKTCSPSRVKGRLFRNYALTLIGGAFAIIVSFAGDVWQARTEAQTMSKAQATTSIIAGYIASWKKLSPVSLPVKRLSHLLYAFGNLSATGMAQLADPCIDAGRCGDNSDLTKLGGNFARLADLKRNNPHLRILVSLGGWTGSKYFSDAAASKQNRERLSQSIIDVFFRPFPGLFDGIDIDWEYPVAGGAEGNHHRPEDRENFVALLAEIRGKLDALSALDGHPYELTIAVSADPATAAQLNLKGLAESVNWIGVMAYDYNAGTTVTGFNAPLYAAEAMPSDDNNVDRSIRYFLKTGVPPQKLVLGVPFYGRAYRDVADDGNGHVHRGHPADEWGGEDGIDYKDILSRRPQNLGFERHWDDKAKVPWLYNRNQRIWISYDDQESIAHKAAYARTHGLAGVMIWELSGDDGTLLPSVNRSLGE
jgi:chitinase